MKHTWMWLAIPLIPLLMSAPASSSEAPSSIPSVDMLNAFMKYKTRNHHRAFYSSEQGSWGMVWGANSEQDAKEKALKNCMKSTDRGDCTLLELNGVILDETQNAKALKKTLKASTKQSWPIPENKLPKELAGEPHMIKGYQDYLHYTGFKAFAVSEDGAWGYSSKFANQKAAEIHAKLNCAKHSKKPYSCTVVDRNNQAVNGWLEADEETNVPRAALSKIPESILTEFQLRDFKEYYASQEGNKAFAVSRTSFGYDSAFAINQGSIAAAKEATLEQCQGRSSKPCRIISVNGELLESSYELASLNDAPLPQKLKLPEALSKKFAKSWGYYQRAKGHRAFAVNAHRAKSEATYFLREKDAQQFALEQCEALAKFHAEKNLKPYARCYVIAANNTLFDYALKKVLQDTEDSYRSAEIKSKH